MVGAWNTKRSFIRRTTLDPASSSQHHLAISRPVFPSCQCTENSQVCFLALSLEDSARHFLRGHFSIKWTAAKSSENQTAREIQIHAQNNRFAQDQHYDVLCLWCTSRSSQIQESNLRGPATILFISDDSCSDSITKPFRACFNGYRTIIPQYVARWGIAQMYLCETIGKRFNRSWCVPGFGAGFDIALEPSKLQKQGKIPQKGTFIFCAKLWYAPSPGSKEI